MLGLRIVNPVKPSDCIIWLLPSHAITKSRVYIFGMAAMPIPLWFGDCFNDNSLACPALVAWVQSVCFIRSVTMHRWMESRFWHRIYMDKFIWTLLSRYNSSLAIYLAVTCWGMIRKDLSNTDKLSFKN